VVKTAISISALPLIGGRFAAAAGAPADGWLRTALVDERNIASRAFGRGALAHGLHVHASRGDWSQLWFTDLDREWRVRPAAIAGVTYHGPLFTFEQLARSRGMRPIFVAELRRYGNGSASLRVSGPAATVARTTQTVGLDDEAWVPDGGDLARAVRSRRCAPLRRARTTHRMSARRWTPIRSMRLIAPAHAARFF
jgi:hypothetical protein